MRKSIKQEIGELIETRKKFRDQEFEMRMNRNNTRARVTTMNAKIGQVNDMIRDLRELEKLEK